MADSEEQKMNRIDLAFILNDCGDDITKAQRRIDRVIEELEHHLSEVGKMHNEQAAEVVRLKSMLREILEAGTEKDGK